MKKPDQVPAESSPFQIDQAIFTSATSAKTEGYHLVAVSPGVSEADRRELSIWGPSHDSLLEPGHGALSVNFHPLPSGSYCVSQTTLEGAEYSGRGPQVYTHSLIVPPAVLETFGANPFVLLREATAAGQVRIFSVPPERLKAFSLPGGNPAVDQELLSQMTNQFGARCLSRLVDACIISRCMGVLADDGAPRLIAGMMNCLPVEIRPTISLSTALKHSPRRPFRVLSAPHAEKERRRLIRQYEVEIFAASGDHNGELVHPWAQFLLTRLEQRDFAQLARELSRARPRLTLEGLADLADDLLSGSESNEASGTFVLADANAVEANAVEANPIDGDVVDAKSQFAKVAVETNHPDASEGRDEPNEPDSLDNSNDPFADTAGDEQPAAANSVSHADESLTFAAPYDASESSTVDSQLETCDEENAFTIQLQEIESNDPDADEPFSELEPATAQENDAEAFMDESESHEDSINYYPNSGEPMTQNSSNVQDSAQETDCFTNDAFGAQPSRNAHKPAFRLSRQCPEAAARLMRLEATVFEAMTGDEDAKNQLAPLWSEVQERLGANLQGTCREEFLHFAIHMWQQFSSHTDRNPLQAAAALDVVCQLFEEPTESLQPVAT